MTAPPFVTTHHLSTLPGIAHGFFGRKGGVSTGLYASLNIGQGSNDDARAIRHYRDEGATPADIRAMVGLQDIG